MAAISRMTEHVPRALGVILAGAVMAASALLARPSVAASSQDAIPQGAAQDVFASRLSLPLVLSGGDVRQLPSPPTAAAPTQTATPAASATPAATDTATASPTASSPPTQIPTPTATAYTEPLTDMAPIRDLRGRYREELWYDTLLELLSRRYPTGHAIVTGVDNSEQEALRWVGDNRGTFDDLMSRTEVTVHEMNHQLGLQDGLLKTGWQQYEFVVRDDRRILVQNHETFPRAEIVPYLTGRLSNRYKPVYLDGDSGQQGFLTLLDEFNAYTHSLFVGYGLNDELRGHSLSYRDGIVTMMMYVEFYLRHGRTEHPDVYARLHDDPEVRQLVGLLWARAMFILDVTEDLPQLRLDPDAVEAEMRTPDMLAEVNQFIQ